MSKFFLLSVLLFLSSFAAKSQEVLVNKKDSTALKPVEKKVDTLKPKYVNPGKIAGRRAMIRSAMLPGLGQVRNGFTFYRGLKVAGIYTGATLLTISFIDNNKSYHDVLKELNFRLDNSGQRENPLYKSVEEQGLVTAKDLYKRNKQIIIFSFVGLYILNVVEAYIDARLKYFDVGDVAVKFSPTMINMNTSTMYGLNTPAPGLKVTLSF
ncbi:hypothetical protein SAMN05421820_111209 [Pedobacter steynii]|uniref:DUF5683 domain-containing protein n=1 Tax=Pedobacter steynii TaxID=430522 RepID=A0A1H0GPQ5_9SPHI|nr:DUF5683 domain-containing protein [Pedobacter steynii]NQX42485.1 hypothetical protein [Pedobacter steynii]SDO08834.1 hypothetical protein SAMN05421820_111209 [Pedobacter steynii]